MTAAPGRDRLRQRVLSALIMGPAAVLAVALGWPAFDLLVAGAAGLMVWEWSTVCCGRRSRAGLAAIAAVAAAPLSLPLLGPWALAVPLLAALPAAALWAQQGAAQRALWVAAGAVYIGAPAVALAWIRTAAGWETVLWLFLVVWATDIGAYAFGRRIGGPLLWPRVSPHKTWAGLIGGVACAGAFAALAGWMLDARALAGILALGVVLGIVSQGGDLVESAFKRHFQVKDTGDLIPGHGGLLDRADGLIAATPVVALAVLLTQGGISTW
jgi:phosphatidate cytidylyltransferase